MQYKRAKSEHLAGYGIGQKNSAGCGICLNFLAGYGIRTSHGGPHTQVMVFNPNKDYILASLCYCDICKADYGSCPLFQKYYPQISQLKITTLRSSTLKQVQSSEPESMTHEFLFEDSVCALAAELSSSLESLIFVHIEEVVEIEPIDAAEDNEESDEDADGGDNDDDEIATVGVLEDKYGHRIPVRNSYVQGECLEKQRENVA